MGSRTVVLLVDPHEDSRTAYALILRHGGYTVLEAGSVAEALSILRRREVNAIITELVLPQIDGCELVRRIKRDPATAHLPVLVITADLSAESREQAEQAKCTAFLLKPCGPKEILQELRDMVREETLPYWGAGEASARAPQ
jgi:CheY-like chemotaxis protein